VSAGSAISGSRELAAPAVLADPHQVGMLAFLVSEAAFFATLLVTYVVFLGQDTSGPTPAEVLSLPLAVLGTLLLVGSSATVHAAEHAWHKQDRLHFANWWLATIALGAGFLAVTAYEWQGLIYRDGLTISRNLFGTTYFTLVGFHALHVTVGLLLMLLVWRATWRLPQSVAVTLVAWYWHFVDGVWLVVFAVVYWLGR
jgi:cytochrome c oxidase subunit 3